MDLNAEGVDLGLGFGGGYLGIGIGGCGCGGGGEVWSCGGGVCGREEKRLESGRLDMSRSVAGDCLVIRLKV